MPRYHSPSPSPDRQARPSRRSTSFSHSQSRPPSPGPSQRRYSHHDADPRDPSTLTRNATRGSSSHDRRGRSRKRRDSSSSHSRRKIPYGFLAGVGISALLLHKYWPKGWVHGEEGYWDKMGREKDKVVDEVKGKKDRAEGRLRDARARAAGAVGMGWDGAREGYYRERDDQRGRPARRDDWDRGYYYYDDGLYGGGGGGPMRRESSRGRSLGGRGRKLEYPGYDERVMYEEEVRYRDAAPRERGNVFDADDHVYDARPGGVPRSTRPYGNGFGAEEWVHDRWHPAHGDGRPLPGRNYAGRGSYEY